MTNLQKGIAAALVAGVATTFVIQHQARLKLGEENQALRRQIAQLQSEAERPKPRLAKPPLRIAARPAVPMVEARATNLTDRFSNIRGPVKLSREQVEAYLKSYGRNAATLLTAFRASDDPALLQEAMEKFPHDPGVDFAAIFRPGASYGDADQTVQDQIDQLAQQRTALMELGNQFSYVASQMSDQDWINYRNRERAFGHTAAQQWAISKYGQH